MFSRILIANRAEIAVRVIRAARELGVETVAVYSTSDRECAHVRLADQAICIGPPAPSESYLNIPRIISAAEVANVDAIHPGYGFLAENAHFAEVCRSCNIEFIGPGAAAMTALGDKVRCKQAAVAAKVPLVPGSKGQIDDQDKAVKVARHIGYPVIIKAAAGGGGRGMRVAHNDISLRSGLAQARAEAEAAFGNSAVFLEKFLEHARHVEVQILGDRHGHVVHLGERDCSMQRRHQKLIEESPCPVLDAATRADMCRAAVRLAKSVGYESAGTFEFLLAPNGEFYLLEVNTRIQVEHPVTEMVTGVDIVQTQIRIAAGQPMPLTQKDIVNRGHAIEVRINAEDPQRNFAPCPGLLEHFDPPGGPGIRVDTHAYSGYRVPPNYDSLLAKLIVHKATRAQAIAAAQSALREFRVGPGATTIPLHTMLMQNSSFRRGEVDIHFVERLLEHRAES
jgi:acetyl-CoA carboxylase biotin carboxylase subunit